MRNLNRLAPSNVLTSELPEPANETLPCYFAWCAARYADRIAVEFQSQKLTYAALKDQIDRFAYYLRGHGVVRGDRVAIYMPRGLSMFVAMLGAMEVGAAYVPMDPSFPLDRVDYIIKDSKAVLLLTTGELGSSIPDVPLLLLDEDLEGILAIHVELPTLPPYDVNPQDLAYIIYTSGSTGRPKGVMIRHASICHFIRSESSILQIKSDDHVFQGFSLSFDMSLEEIWTTFWAGAKLLVAGPELINAGPELGHALAQAGITVWHCVPTMLAMQDHEIPSLRLINLGGEACPADLVKRWHHPGRRILNTYGPTETTVTATFAELLPDEPVTIGRPLPGYETFVLNEHLRVVADGAEGELCIAGPGLAVGYVNQETLTHEKFVSFDDPATGLAKAIYRSGDLVRLDEKGNIVFLGRIDTQIKIRGFRVELAEIESVLMQDTAIKSAAVALLKDSHEIETLVAFAVLKSGIALDEAALWQFMRSRMPPYMVPTVISILNEFPLLPSGKIDRKKLHFPEGAQVRSRAIIAPSTLLEIQLHSVWSKLFAPAPVSIDDDFFLDLGGHSLRAALMVSQMRKEMNLSIISMQHIYQHSTIRKLAAYLEENLEVDHGESLLNPFHHVPNLRYYLCIAAQCVGLIFIFGIFALQWIVPFFSYSYATHHDEPKILSLLIAICTYAATFPLVATIAIVSKWLVIGRYKEGDYPLWGSYYLRWWFVRRIQDLVPRYMMRGTAMLNTYYRLMGTKIGKGVYVGNVQIDAPDLLTIGHGTSIGDGAMISSCSVEKGLLRLRRVAIGNRCVLGQMSGIGMDSVMEDGSELDDLSLLPNGHRLPEYECWAGSPSRFQSKRNKTEVLGHEVTSKWNWQTNLMLGILTMCLPVFALGPVLPGLILISELDYNSNEIYFLLSSPLVALFFVFSMSFQIIALKKIILGRMTAGKVSLKSMRYVRFWFVSRLMDINLELIKPLYATLYLAPLYRALGVKIGKRSEVSTAESVLWDLLSLDDECFIADGVSLGVPRIADGYIHFKPTVIGKRTFLGNSSLISAGATLGDKVLIGCLSVPPKDPKKQAETSASWFGSPALFLPQRQTHNNFDERSTFLPSRQLYVSRLVIEFIRILLPLSCIIGISSLVVSVMVTLTFLGYSAFSLLLLLPFIGIGAGLTGAIITLVIKRLVVGKYSPRIRPLWSPFVWRSELVTCLYENLAVTLLINHLRGTPFINMYLRLIGCKIGRRVYTDTTDITEFDVVTIGDDVALNDECGLQTHLFEDRLMKISYVTVGDRCTVGSRSIVLYDSVMEPDSQLGDLSMLMKGETLPRGTEWEGSPAQKVVRKVP
ncbi:MAG: amino acid adenylation domain-containing protein [Chitinophagaceae bacterium]|nr:amino acid adenylation domain-containing protein [Oligoflexus sp.]